jgi:hypothetical protein
MEPETFPEPVQLNSTGFVPDVAEPEPTLVVAQPTTNPTLSRNPALKITEAMMNLQ